MPPLPGSDFLEDGDCGLVTFPGRLAQMNQSEYAGGNNTEMLFLLFVKMCCEQPIWQLEHGLNLTKCQAP